ILKLINLSHISLSQLLQEGTTGQSPGYVQALLGEPAAICKILQNAFPAEIQDWSFQHIHKTMAQEVQQVSLKNIGLHFNTSHATSDTLYESFVDVAAMKMGEKSPMLWRLMGMLLDLDENRRRVSCQDLDGHRGPEVLAWLGSKGGGDLGEIGEDG
ncbi:hypothetical protein FA15DRAFT_550312, partial [Coprinopsis marcescibilis]